MTTQTIDWTDEITDEVRKCYNRGWSCSKTATHMNHVFRDVIPYNAQFSRNGIAGKWGRMGLKRGKADNSHNRNHATNGFGFNCGPRDKKGKKRKPKVGRGTFKDIKVLDGEAPGKTFDSLDEYGTIKCCRWPFEKAEGGIDYCGNKIETKGRPYCDSHLTRAYQKDLRGVPSKT